MVKKKAALQTPTVLHFFPLVKNWKKIETKLDIVNKRKRKKKIEEKKERKMSKFWRKNEAFLFPCVRILH